MLKLLRRKSFRKSKDLNSENSVSGRGGGQCGQYSVRERRRSGSRVSSSHSLTGTGGQAPASASLDREHVRRYSRYSSLSNTVSEEPSDQPPEILQYARPPENLSSPVRESNGYLPTTDSYPVSQHPGCETTVQKLFFDSVVNGNNLNRKPNVITKSSTTFEADSAVGHKEASEARPAAVIVRESLVGGAPPVQPHPYIRRSSNNNTSVTNNNKPGFSVHKNVDDSNKTGRRSVMTVLRQSFRKNKKDRPTVVARNTHNSSKVRKASDPSHQPQPPAAVSKSVSVEDHSKVCVASVRASRTLTPSRASIVSRTSLASRSSLADTREAARSGSAPRVTGESGRRDSSETSDTSSVNMKTVTSPSSAGAGGYPMARSASSKPAHSSRTDTSSTTPTATPRQGGQRFLPETPKLVASLQAVPPIYANVHQQLSPGPGPGNNRQMAPGVAKMLEESGNKRGASAQENNGVAARSPSSSSSAGPGVARSASSSQVPPAVPKPAARMSLRQKVELTPGSSQLAGQLLTKWFSLYWIAIGDGDKKLFLLFVM